MSDKNKSILREANDAVAAGDYERFLTFCTDGTEWTFVGDKILRGKDVVREWMRSEYIKPPKNYVKTMISEGNLLAAIGEIFTVDESGRSIGYSYCDTWTLRDSKLDKLQAFVIPLL